MRVAIAPHLLAVQLPGSQRYRLPPYRTGNRLGQQTPHQPFNFALWHGFLSGRFQQVQDLRGSGKTKFIFRRLFQDDLPDEEVLSVTKMLSELAQVVTFRFVPTRLGKGQCTSEADQRISAVGTDSKIEMRKEMLDALDTLSGPFVNRRGAGTLS